MANKKFKQKSGMVDISAKDVTKRTARAGAVIRFSKNAFTALVQDKSPKGNVLETAKVAGIMAAKNTPQIIPMCHPLELSKVKIDFELNASKSEVAIVSEVVCLGRTGVEMEALAAVTVAALTVYDMMKWADKGIRISDIELLSKTGGKSGDFHAGK